ncbi:hypothetical protein Mapa_017086 [Marchantia paleacea]|nr:hypothetical protein Mapa_017086 [Marchantia paleacea]
MVGPLGSLITRYLSCVLRNIAGGLGSGRCVWKRRVHSTGFMNKTYFESGNFLKTLQFHRRVCGFVNCEFFQSVDRI